MGLGQRLGGGGGVMQTGWEQGYAPPPVCPSTAVPRFPCRPETQFLEAICWFPLVYYMVGSIDK